MIAVLVLGLAITAYLGGISAALRTQVLARAHLEAVALAEARMSEMVILPTDSLAGYLRIREGTAPPPFERYRWSAVVRPDALDPRLLELAVRIDWSRGSYDLETTLHRSEPWPLSRGDR